MAEVPLGITTSKKQQRKRQAGIALYGACKHRLTARDIASGCRNLTTTS